MRTQVAIWAPMRHQNDPRLHLARRLQNLSPLASQVALSRLRRYGISAIDDTLAYRTFLRLAIEIRARMHVGSDAIQN